MKVFRFKGSSKTILFIYDKGIVQINGKAWQSIEQDVKSLPFKLGIVVVWMRTAPIDSGIWNFGHQLLELFGKDEWLWLCWRRCVSRDRIWHLKSPHHSQWVFPLGLTVVVISGFKLQLLLQNHDCLSVVMLPAIRVMKTHSETLRKPPV